MPVDLINVHPSERLALPGGGGADIDVEMVPLMRALWRLGLGTRGCCQDFGESILGNGHQSTTSDDDRRRHAAFFAGQAWLKMPVDDAVALLDIVAGHDQFAERVRRWTHPEAWMSVIYVFPTDAGGVEPAKAVQLHFPREQIPDLTAALSPPPSRM